MNQAFGRIDAASATPVMPMFNLDFDRIWVPVRRSLVPMAAIVAACVAAALLAFVLIRPSYRAEAKLRIDATVQRVVGTEDAATPVQVADIDRQMETTLLMARSVPVAEAVMRALKLSGDDAFLHQMHAAPAATPVERRAQVLKLLDRNRSATIIPNSRVASIGFASPDADLSARIANSFTDNLVRYDLQQRAGQSNYAREFLEGELAKIRTRLSSSERSANDYARGAAIISVPARQTERAGATLTSDTLNQVNQQLTDAAQRRIRAQADWNAIAGRAALSIPEVIGNSAVQSLVSQLSDVRAKLNAAAARHGPEHPEVRQLEAQFASLRGELTRLSEGIKTGLRTPLDSAIRDERDLRARFGALQSSRLSEQDRSVNLAILQREADTNRNQYDALLARLNQLNAEAGVQVSNLSILDRAVAPERPYFPSLPLFGAVGLLLGVVLALLFLLVRELLFARLRTPADIAARLNLPVIAAVPTARHASDGWGDVQGDLRLESSYSEAIAALDVATDHGLPKSVLVTSASVGDGKSTTVRALAQAVGATGKSVLVIDGDLRRPVQHRLFGVNGAHGLTEVLAGQRSLPDATQRTAMPGVDVLPVGTLPPQPAVLLASPRLREAIATATNAYDLVLVDAPPVIGFGDPLLLAARTQTVVFAIRADTSRVSRVQGALGKLARLGITPLGALLTFYRPTNAEAYDYDLYRHTPAA